MVITRAFVPLVAPAPFTVVSPLNTGVVTVGDVENTRLVLVVPVVPAALKPVMLLKHVTVADVQFVPPCATGSAAAK